MAMIQPLNFDNTSKDEPMLGISTKVKVKMDKGNYINWRKQEMVWKVTIKLLKKE